MTDDNLAELARRLEEVNQSWEALRRVSHEDAIEQRLLEMEQAADKANDQLGRDENYEYRGGPVEWEDSAE